MSAVPHGSVSVLELCPGGTAGSGWLLLCWIRRPAFRPLRSEQSGLDQGLQAVDQALLPDQAVDQALLLVAIRLHHRREEVPLGHEVVLRGLLLRPASVPRNLS